MQRDTIASLIVFLSFLASATFMLIGVKLNGVDWPWWVVFSPLWSAAAVVALFLMFAFIITLIKKAGP